MAGLGGSGHQRRAAEQALRVGVLAAGNLASAGPYVQDQIMSDVDYSAMRSIADEPHWNDFVQSVGGELIAPLITRQGVLNADYLFAGARVIAELKVLQTEFAQSREMLAKVDGLIQKYPGVDPDSAQRLRRELLAELRKPLQRIINKANRQIKQTKVELGLSDHRGILICAQSSAVCRLN